MKHKFRVGALLALTLACSSVGRSAELPPASDPLFQIARESLEKNIVHLTSGDYLVAGQHQFYSLWTRDFCFASRGLLALGDFGVVHDQLSKVLEFRRPQDGLVPRVADSMSSHKRVNDVSLARIFPWLRGRPSLQEPIHAEYFDENGSQAIDSNALVLMTALDYVGASGDSAWWKQNLQALVQVYRFYDSRRDPADGLVVQEKFSDWQDSVKREGKTFYTNLLFYALSRRLSADPAFAIRADDLEKLHQSIERRFFDPVSGLYRSVADHPYLSLDGNLLAIDWGYLAPSSPQARALYLALRRSRLWTDGDQGMPGWVTYPDYPSSWREGKLKIAGLQHYHDHVYWSWLIALSAKVAAVMGDKAEAERILTGYRAMVVRDRSVAEIYRWQPGLPAFRSWLYQAEAPFSWGAGFTVDMMKTVRGGSP